MKTINLLIILSVIIAFNNCDGSNVESSDNSNQFIDDKNKTSENATLKSNDFEKRYPNGQLEVKGQFKNNKKDSLWTAYFPNGTKQSENYYSNNILHGNTITYYENGKVRYRGFYLEGEKHGKWIFWDKKGNEKVVEYKHGVEQ